MVRDKPNLSYPQGGIKGVRVEVVGALDRDLPVHRAALLLEVVHPPVALALTLRATRIHKSLPKTMIDREASRRMKNSKCIKMG